MLLTTSEIFAQTLPSMAKRANLDAPIRLNKGSFTRKSDTDCCITFSPAEGKKCKHLNVDIKE